MSFDKLKRNKNRVQKLREEVEKTTTTRQNFTDDRIWKPSPDKAGNGFAEFRFLPESEGNTLPWIQYWDHGFEGPTGKWYIEKLRTTLGENDPVSEYNSALWDTGREEDKEQARKQKRRLHYVSNILMVNDPANPENNGKVFLYVYGKKIFDKLMDAMQPEFPDEAPLDPFDFWKGANFKLKIRKVDGWTNYDKSEFADVSPLSDDDELKTIYEKLYDLREFTAPESFKSYEQLKEKFEKVMGLNSKPRTVKAEVDLDNHQESKLEKPDGDEEMPQVSENESDDDTMSFFQKFAEDD